MMLHTKYHGSMPCGFGLEDFVHVFPRTCDPGLGPLEHDLNKLGRSPLDDATYQIALPCRFKQNVFS